MYCPNCGSNNQAEIKFCTRCGTNLAAVSEALSGKAVSVSETDARMVELLKKYYNGRRAVAVGAGSLIIGLAVLALVILSGMGKDDSLANLLLIGLAACALVHGAIATIAGIGYWIESGSEMEAIKSVAPHVASQRLEQKQLETAPAEQVGGLTNQYSTDPIPAPASVTEHTTRQLEERDGKTRQAN